MPNNKNEIPRRELTDSQRSEIIGAYKCGVKGLTISQKLGHSSSTVYDTINRYEQTGSPHPQIRLGPSNILTKRNERALIRITNKHHDATLADITEEFRTTIGTSISTKTTSKYLCDLGWSSCFKCKKPFLTKSHAKIRLGWCREHAKWVDIEWRYVVFTDESRFCMNRPDGGERVWRRAHEKYHKDCITPTVKFKGGGVMFWGCFTWWGVGPLIRIDGTMDANVYIDTLAKQFVPWAQPLAEEHSEDADLIFQQDSASVHTANYSKWWMSTHGFHILD